MLTLSIDGGGIRGIIPAMILDHIETEIKKPITKIFDHIAGTSTGGILALGLTKPTEISLHMRPEPRDSKFTSNDPQYSAKDLVDFYKYEGKKIFKHSILRDLFTAKGVLCAKYDRTYLDKLLDETFGTVLIQKALTNVSIPAYSLTLNEIILITNNSHWQFKMGDIAAITSAAPYYFAPRVIKPVGHKHIAVGVDGGLFADDPNLLHLLKYGNDCKDIVNIAIGTGERKRLKPNITVTPSGLISWFTRGNSLIDSMLRADSQLGECVAHKMYKENYRLQPILPESYTTLDDASDRNIGVLQDCAKKYIDSGALKEIVWALNKNLK